MEVTSGPDMDSFDGPEATIDATKIKGKG